MAGLSDFTVAQFARPTNLEQYDVTGPLNAYRQGMSDQEAQAQNFLKRQVGGTLAGQGYLPAADVAAAGGDVQTSMDLQQMPVKKLVQMNDIMGRAATAVPDGDQTSWNKVLKTFEPVFGSEALAPYRDVATKNQWIDQSKQLQNQIDLQAKQADVEYKKAATAKLNAEAAMPGGKPFKEFTVSDTDKLTEQAGSVETLGSLINSFKPEYSGYKLPGQLDLAKQGMPTLNATDKEASDWWDAYNQWVEPVRKGLYGSVLTPGERSAFEAARITPRTDPAVVPKNLAKQQEIMTKALNRKSDTLKASGYNPNAVDAALGIEGASPSSPPAVATPKTIDHGNGVIEMVP